MPISKPNVTLNILPAKQLSGVQGQRVLIVGQKTSAGTAASGSLVSDVGNSTNAINELFGERSILAEQLREFKKYNKLTSIDAIPLSDNSTAEKATAKVTFSGIATAAGRLIVTFGSDKRYRTNVDISLGDTAEKVATAVANAFSQYTSSPFQVENEEAVVTATAENGGTHANDWTISVEGKVADITYTVVGWANGATDPVLTSVLDVIGNTRYQTVIWPAVYDVTIIENVLNARFNTNNDVSDGVAFQFKKGTLSALKSYASPLNSQSIVIFGDKTVNETARKGTALREIPDVSCAQAAALRALRLTSGGNLTQYLTTTSTLDQFGGAAIASLPYFNTALPNLPVPLPEDEFSDEDQLELNNNGVAILGANRTFNTTLFGEAVTTYLTDNAGNQDSSYKFLNTVDTASVVRETFFHNYKKEYAQSRLTEGDLIAGLSVVNKESIRAFSLEVYRSLAISGLVAAGGVAEQDFLDNLSISINLASGTITVAMAPLLVTQLRAIIGTIEINFGRNK